MKHELKFTSYFKFLRFHIGSLILSIYVIFFSLNFDNITNSLSGSNSLYYKDATYRDAVTRGHDAQATIITYEQKRCFN